MNTLITEKDWQGTVIELAHTFDWRVAHFRPARTKDGWRTAVSADGAGFPDLCLVRENGNGEAELLFIELKSEKGETSKAQKDWLVALNKVPSISAFVFRPSDWDEVVKVLNRY